jgi:hypothetical protein
MALVKDCDNIFTNTASTLCTVVAVDAVMGSLTLTLQSRFWNDNVYSQKSVMESAQSTLKKLRGRWSVKGHVTRVNVYICY